MVAGYLVEVLGDKLTINIVSFPLLPFAELLVRAKLDTDNGLVGHSYKVSPFRSVRNE